MDALLDPLASCHYFAQEDEVFDVISTIVQERVDELEPQDVMGRRGCCARRMLEFLLL